MGGLDYEVLCGEWSGNKASRLGGGNRTGAGGSAHAGQPSGGGGEEEARGPVRGVAFRGDSRWTGLAKAQGQNLLAGLSHSLQLYIAEYAVA